MARTSTRRWKGCPLCKMHKYAGKGDTERAPLSVLRAVGKQRRWNRHSVPSE